MQWKYCAEECLPKIICVVRDMLSFLWYHDSLQWRNNERNGVSNHRRLHCLLNCWFRRRSKKISKHCITGLSAGNSPVTGEFPAQKASNAENGSIWWCHHEFQWHWFNHALPSAFTSSPPWTKCLTFSQTTFSNAFSWLKNFVCQFEFHWSLFLKVRLTISQP